MCQIGTWLQKNLITRRNENVQVVSPRIFHLCAFLAPRDYVYEQVNTKGQIVEEQEEQDFRPEVYKEPEFLSDCIEYEMDICFEPKRKRAKF